MKDIGSVCNWLSIFYGHLYYYGHQVFKMTFQTYRTCRFQDFIKTMRNTIYLLIVLIIVSCKDKTPYMKISDRINTHLKNDSILYKSLITGYNFRLYKDGVGPDTSKPIINDTIIILKNHFTQHLLLSHINDGKVVLLDSTMICKLVFQYDNNRQFLRSFLSITTKDKNAEFCLKAVNWVAQYKNTPKCIEIQW